MQIDTNIPEVARRQIEHIAEVCERIKPLVVIRCITYNHEAFLKDALEGFLMQKTDFPFVAVVHDDASTDGTAAVLHKYAEQYPDIILPIYEEENQYSKRDRSVGRIMNAASKATGAKYVAMCEGDDYWIDENKLKKQVDFLDKNLDYGMVFTDYDILYHKSNRVQHALIGSGKNSLITNFEQHLRRLGYIAPMSWMYRREFLGIEGNYKGKIATDGSFIFALEMFLNSKIFYLNQVTCVYRELQNSASHKVDKSDRYRYHKGLYKTQEYYVNNYNVSEETRLSLSWFYQWYAPYIILKGYKDEIDSARVFLRSHCLDKNITIRRRVYILSVLLYDWLKRVLRHLTNRVVLL